MNTERYAIFEQLSDGVQIIDDDMRYVYLNPALLSEIGMTSEQVVGFAMSEKFPGIEDTEIYRQIHSCRNSRRPEQVLNEFTFPDGTRAFHELSLQAIDDGVIIFSRNITKTKTGEALTRQTSQNLFQFAHITAHDMREPLRRMQVLLEELALDYGQNLPPEALGLCDALGEQVRILTRMVNDFRHLSDLGGLDPKRSPCSVTSIARNLLEEIGQDTALERFDWVGEEPQVLAAPTLLKILLRHLLEDAVTHALGRINFSVERDTPETTPTFSLSYALPSTRRPRDVFSPAGMNDLERGERLPFLIMRKVVARHRGRIWSERSGETFRARFTLEA